MGRKLKMCQILFDELQGFGNWTRIVVNKPMERGELLRFNKQARVGTMSQVSITSGFLKIHIISGLRQI